MTTTSTVAGELPGDCGAGPVSQDGPGVTCQALTSHQALTARGERHHTEPVAGDGAGCGFAAGNDGPTTPPRAA